MRAFRFLLAALVIGLAVYAKLRSTSSDGESRGAHHAYAYAQDDRRDDGAIPAKAYDVLAYVRRTGEAPPGYVGGRTFENREGRLPYGGDYREFDVDPHSGHRNAQRLIVDWNTKRAWYTGDHYRTFVPLP